MTVINIAPGERTYGAPALPTVHPRPWWFRLLNRLAPGRCREIPEPRHPDQVLLRQFAIIKRYVYLQQFASSESADAMHSHPYRYMIAIGLWGGYTEHRIAGESFKRRAPYCFTMDSGHVHHVQNPKKGHTSIFIGIKRASDATLGDKRYFGVPMDAEEIAEDPTRIAPSTVRALWSSHIQKFVKRI